MVDRDVRGARKLQVSTDPGPHAGAVWKISHKISHKSEIFHALMHADDDAVDAAHA